MPVPDYDFWLFDLDGTLVDTEWSYVRTVYDEVGTRLGREFGDEDARGLWYGLSGTRNDQLRAAGIDPEAFWPTLHAVEDPVARANASYVHEDAARLVSAIDAPVGVVTHCAPFLTEGVLDGLDIRDWFDDVVTCSDDTGWKPDPEPVRHAMARLGVARDHRGVLAGDGESDVGAAWNAGLDGVHVERHGPESRGRCVLGDYRVRSLDELLVGGAAGD